MLTHRQKQVVSGIASSFTLKQIASMVGIGLKCVHYHLIQARSKIGFPKKEFSAFLTRYAYENHLIKIDKTGAVVDSYLNSRAGQSD